MNTLEQQHLDDYIEGFEEAKQIYIKVMNQEIDNDAALLLRWMVNNKVNPWGVFPAHVANAMSTLEGFEGTYFLLTHALLDDGDISFVRIQYTTHWDGDDYDVEHEASPRVVFLWEGDKDFVEEVKQLVFTPNKENLVDFKVETIRNVRDYIREYERVEERRKSDFLIHPL